MALWQPRNDDIETPTEPVGPEDKPPTEPTVGQVYSYQDWIDYVATNYPGVVISEANYNAYVGRFNEGDLRSQDPGYVVGTDPGFTEEDKEREDQHNADLLAYNQYKNAGGTRTFNDWLAAGKPTKPHIPVGQDVPYEPPIVDGVDGGDAVTVDGNGGEEDDFSAQLAAAVEAYRTQIREMGERERAEAQRLGARDIGKMARMTRQAMLARGRTAGEIEQLTAGGMEAGARSLNDLLQALNIQTQRQMAGAEQFGIGTMISGEELGIRERQMAQQMGQYQQSFEEQRRQFGLGYGLSQEQLAQQAQQAQAQAYAPLWGALGQIGGGALGSIFGPAGTAAGSWLGGKVAGWLGA